MYVSPVHGLKRSMCRKALPVLFLLVLIPATTSAQVVRGQLLNGETGLPLEGAMIVLQGAGAELGTVLSNAAGRFLIGAPGPGTFTVRADRIGHASTTSGEFSLAAGDTVDISLTAEVMAIRLAGLEVEGERRCVVRPESGRAVATLWGEVRKALAAAALTDETGLYRYRTMRFFRDLDQSGRRVLSEERRASQGYLEAPFESLPASTLMTEGFMHPDPEGDLYFAPDAKVLLSDEFLDTHCLGITTGDRDTAGLIGVAFAPTDDRKVPEIRGVVWVDPVSAELRHVDYTYDNLAPGLRSDAVGGKVVFKGLPNGTWIVTDWRIRMPSAASAPDHRGGRQLILAGIREVGGEVDRVQDQRGQTILEAQRATLTGIVLDETGLAPLAGATVRLQGTGAVAQTRADGSFSLPGQSEGVYSVEFSHPSLPQVPGFPEPVEVELTAGAVSSVSLVSPPLPDLLEAACGENERPEGSAVVSGVIRDGATGEPIPGATVRVLWTDYRFRGTGVARGGQGQLQALIGMQDDGLQGESDPQGRFLACGVPADHPVRLEAESEAIVSESLALRIPPDSLFLNRDVTILRSATGTISGRAVDWVSGEPLEGVSITIQTRGTIALTGGNGRFRFEGIPVGRHVLAAELLGHASLTDTVTVRPDPPVQLELRLPTEALEIEGISVEVFSQNEMDFRREGFSGGRSDAITPEEMDLIRDRVTDIVDIIQKMGSPRIRIVDTNTLGIPLGFCITWTRREISIQAGRIRAQESAGRGTEDGCNSMLIVLDGIPQQDMGGYGPTIPASDFIMDLTPEEIQSVRVLSPVQARFQYGAQGDRGALIIETRLGGRRGGG